MSPARVLVRAVVVSDGRAPQLPVTLERVLTQDPPPDIVHLVLTTDVDWPDEGWDARLTVSRVDAPGFGAAVAAVLADHEPVEHELLWLLHDDMAPQPGALAALAATARKRRRAGVIGAAQVRWDDPSRLVGLGTTTSLVGARRLALVEEDDVNQGQYDERDDVLAVSLGGALVRREVWDALGGTDPACHGWNESLDFCRRAWRAGHDVVTVPAAKVRHSQERLYGRRGGSAGGRRSTYAARRASEWYHACAYAPWWAVPLLLAWSVLSAVGRALLRIAQNEPRLLVGDLTVPWRLLVLLPSLPQSRRRVRAAGKEGVAAERRLLAGPRQIAHYVRAREWGVFDRDKAARVPSDVVQAELRRARARRRSVLGALSAALVGLSIALHPDWLVGLARGEMLAGTALGVTDVSAGDLWDRALTGWSTQGFGAPSLDAGLSAVLVPFAAVPGGLAVGLGALLLFAPALAGWAAWAATGTATRSLWTRALVAVVYALWPAALQSMADGRVAAVLVHVLLPWAVVGLARAGGWHRGERIGDGEEHPEVRRASPSAAMGAAAVLAVAVMAAPVLLLPALIVVGALGCGAGRARWRVWAAALPALVVSAPGVIAAAAAGPVTAESAAVLAREPGPSLSAPAQSGLGLLLGPFAPTGPVPAVLVDASRGLAVVVLVVSALAVLVTLRRAATSVALLSVAMGLVVAVVVQGVTMSPDTGAGGAAASGWYGPGMSVVAVGLLVIVGTAAADLWFTGDGRARAWRRTLGSVAAVAVALLAAGAVASLVWPSRTPAGDVAPTSRDMLPLVAALEQVSPERQRVLVMTEREAEVEYAVLESDGTEVISTAATLDPRGVPAARAPGTPVAGPAALADAVGRLAAGGDGSADELAGWGVGVVVAAPGSPLIADVLSQNADLELMGASDRGTSWRVGAAEGDGRVSLGWFEGVDGDAHALDVGRSVATGPVDGAGTVVLAVAADPAWRASVDGVPLVGSADDWGRQTFEVGRAGTVRVEYDDRAYRVGFWASIVVVGWSLVGAIPLRSRRARREATI